MSEEISRDAGWQPSIVSLIPQLLDTTAALRTLCGAVQLLPRLTAAASSSVSPCHRFTSITCCRRCGGALRAMTVPGQHVADTVTAARHEMLLRNLAHHHTSVRCCFIWH